MSTVAPLHSIATSLDTYRTQFVALGNALSALRVVSDQMIAQLDRDREALETQIQAAIAIEAAAQAEADAAVGDRSAADETTAVGEVQTATELHEGHASDALAAEAGQITETVAVAAVEHVSGSFDETSPIETEIPISKDATVEAKIEINASASDIAIPTAEAAEPTVSVGSTDATNEGTAASDSAIGDSKVISLADRRKTIAATSPARRRAKAFVASILVAAGATFGLHELLQSELGQRMMELGTCDGDMLSATRDCSLLAWLTI